MEKSTFVLVHGGRHGGWCWKFVAPLLRAAGHPTYAVTLTGLGERAHLLTPQVDLRTHVQDVVSTFEHEDLTDVVLVAHSYGGLVSSAALEEVADRVRHVVFVDAQMARSGESMFDMTPPRLVEALLAVAAEQGDGWRVPPVDASWWGVDDPELAAWVTERITAHPLRTYQDRPGTISRVWELPGTFVECSPSMLPDHMLERMREHAATAPAFAYRRLDACHDAMVTRPAEVAALLIEAATPA
jgi:pimeloyl-ACP methyl ester carboxylesterase